MADVGRCQFKQGNQIKASNFTKRPRLEMAKKRNCAHQKHAKQQKESYSIYSLSRCFSKWGPGPPRGPPCGVVTLREKKGGKENKNKNKLKTFFETIVF